MGATAVELFEEQVRRSPDSVALRGLERLTYRQLSQRANQLAHLLRLRGAGPESIVGIYLDRGPEVVVAVLATLEAGAAYLPLDPAYPPERLRYMVEDSRLSLLVS